MKRKQLLLPILTVAMALGTGWAVRGKFGHEQGAAWAGAIGALSLILVAKRADWYAKAFRITMAAAFGWGISGVMSYGLIVGYGRGTDFVNVFYGLLMLFVLGLLYGFLGGGLFGLALLDSKEKPIPWHSVLAEMIAFGILVYAFLIDQLGWLMTPPRSEAWALCLGASIALAWYLARQQFNNVIKVAVCSALGAGFGFSFGNFIQVLGNASGIDFNFWNVMEYSIGFFGGLGMAYGTFTSAWPVLPADHRPRANLLPIIFIALFVPFVVWDQSFVTDRFDFIVEEGHHPSLIFYFKTAAILAILAVAALALLQNYNRQLDDYVRVRRFFTLYTVLYIFLSFLVTGVLTHPVEQYLYILNFVIITILVSRAPGNFAISQYRPQTWLIAGVVCILFIAVLAVIAINSHDAMPGSQVRFGKK